MSTNTPGKDARVQTFNITEQWYDRVAKYADDNSLSVSEAFTEIITAYANGEVPPPQRQRRSRRVSIWISPQKWSAMRKKAQKDGVRLIDAIEAAIEEAV